MSLPAAAKDYAAAVEAKRAHIRTGGAAKGLQWLTLTARVNETRKVLLMSAKAHGSRMLRTDQRAIRGKEYASDPIRL